MAESFQAFFLLTAISRQADIERPAPSICFRAYSLGSVLKENMYIHYLLAQYVIKVTNSSLKENIQIIFVFLLFGQKRKPKAGQENPGVPEVIRWA